MSLARYAPRALGRLGLVATLCFSGCFPGAAAHAADFTVKDGILLLTGAIENDEWNRFRDTLDHTAPGEVKLVVLSSPGGSINSAGEMGRIIRAHRLATLVDGTHGICLSACTIVFAGGVQRIYLNPPGDGGVAASHNIRGLGFHQGHTGTFVDSYSVGGPSMMVKFFFNEFGVPGAADLVDMAPPDKIYMLSGREALARGIATRLR